MMSCSVRPGIRAFRMKWRSSTQQRGEHQERETHGDFLELKKLRETGDPAAQRICGGLRYTLDHGVESRPASRGPRPRLGGKALTLYHGAGCTLFSGGAE